MLLPGAFSVCVGLCSARPRVACLSVAAASRQAAQVNSAAANAHHTMHHMCREVEACLSLHFVCGYVHLKLCCVATALMLVHALAVCRGMIDCGIDAILVKVLGCTHAANVAWMHVQMMLQTSQLHRQAMNMMVMCLDLSRLIQYCIFIMQCMCLLTFCVLHCTATQVAAMGLDPHKHLGKSIAQMEPTLHRLAQLYGCNVCGEGGEYETLTLDCPVFTHGRIVLDEWQVGQCRSRPFATICHC